MVMLIFLNHYREARKILHNVIQKKLLPPTVYTTTRLEDGTCWINHITLCIAIKTIATHSVWHIKIFSDIVVSNVNFTQLLLAMRCEMNRTIVKIFFPACKKLDKRQSKIKALKPRFLQLQAWHLCPQLPFCKGALLP